MVSGLISRFLSWLWFPLRGAALIAGGYFLDRELIRQYNIIYAATVNEYAVIDPSPFYFGKILISAGIFMVSYSLFQRLHNWLWGLHWFDRRVYREGYRRFVKENKMPERYRK